MTIRLSPDGQYYAAMAQGERVPSPYNRRWLLPKLAQQLGVARGLRAWIVLTWIALALTPLAAYAYSRDWRATALLCVMPGVWRCSLRFPVLTDAISFTLTLATAACFPHHPTLGIALSVVLGAVSERGPVFAALWAWSPLPLLGFIAQAGAPKPRPILPGDPPWLREPVRSALTLRRVVGFDGSLYVIPFAPALAGLSPSLQSSLTLLVALAQLAFAQDTIRLLIWAAPPLVMSAVAVLPAWVLIPLVVGTLIQRDDRV